MRSYDETPWNAPEPPFLSEASRKAGWSDWEFSYYPLFFGGLALLFVGEAYRPDRRIESWARDEAEERNRREQRGEEVVLGHNYAAGQTGTRTIIGSQQPYEWSIGFSKPERRKVVDDE
jgi:hypothetical protein